MLKTKIDPKKTTTICIRVLESDKEELKQWVVENSNLNFSEFVRESILLNVETINRVKGNKE